MFSGRIFGSWGIEHVVIKGNNGMTIFNDDEDCSYFMNLLHSKQKSSTILISYVLMKNHVHLILKEKSPENISNLMMTVCGPYAYWFNKKYGRKNALFRQRFYNENIEEERHLINAIRYIHNNPVKAKIVSHPQRYRWSSYNEYLGKAKYVDKSVFEQYFSPNDFIYNDSQIASKYKDNDLYYNSVEYANLCVNEYLEKVAIKNIDRLSTDERNELIKDLWHNKKVCYGIISEFVGISKEAIRKIVR